MEKIDFFELATYCTNKYRESHNTNNNSYAGTLYVAILEDNQVMCSKTPHILRNCVKCILVHRRDTLAQTNSYYWYNVEVIDENGCIYDGNLGNGYSIEVNAWGQYSNQIMSLDYNSSHLFWCRPPFEDHMPKVWELYTRLKDVPTEKEIKLIADLFRKDEKILELEKEIEDFKFTNLLLEQERNQYKEMLDEIRDVVKNKE
jgi:hypothetical protein